MAMKSCAIGGYTFGHELGHNFGCHHDIVSATNTYFSYGHGHHIEQGQASQGYRTVLAYTAPNHRARANYYSNPAVILPITGTPTGVEGVSDNARVITENRFAFASLGNEANTCSNGSVTTSTSTSSPTTSISSSTSSGGCGNCVFPFIYGNRQSDRCTSIDGDSPWCATAVDSSGKMTTWEYCQVLLILIN